MTPTTNTIPGNTRVLPTVSSAPTLRAYGPIAGPPAHHSTNHAHTHHYRPTRPRQRSTSRSSSSPSPPPAAAGTREKRRSFSSRSPAGTVRRASRYEASPLQTTLVSRHWTLENAEGSVYGASASSAQGMSESESGADRFVSVRGGDDTEVEVVRKRRSSEEVERLTGGKSTSEVAPPERMMDPPQVRTTISKRAHLGYTLFPATVGSRQDPKGRKKPGWQIHITRQSCENAIILGGVGWGIIKLGCQWDERALAGEIGLLVGLSIVYTTFRFRPLAKHPSAVRPSSPATITFNLPDKPHQHIRERLHRPSMSHGTSGTIGTAVAPGKERSYSDENFGLGIGGRGCVWGTEEREYRECLDDGVFFALLLGPLIAAALLHAALTQLSAAPTSAILKGWKIENPLVLPSTPIRQLKGVVLPSTDSIKILSASATSRRNLVQLFTLCSFVLLVQLAWSLRLEVRLSKQTPNSTASVGMERDISDHARPGAAGTYWLRKGELRRNLSVVAMAFMVTGGCIIVKIVTAIIGHGVWSDMSPSDIIIATLFYQFSLYVCVRLARRGFTLGELAVVCNAATAMFMETVNLTRMKIRILRTPYIKTYRLPTPLLTFQLALIPGSLLAGFLLSPLLYLSRHLAQRPAHRLRFPHEKPVHRRLLALGFYGGAALVCGGLVGTWARWCLGWRDPCMWVIYYLFDGTHKWTRPALISYWTLLAMVSVAGWSRQLTRARRHRRYLVPGTRERDAKQEPMKGEAAPGVAAQMMDAADSRMPTLSVNARRKFFHALAVIMFVPGIAVDPAFTHLSFSVAFAAFTFAEYIRYFALWPFGVSVHLFLNEFLDHKDSGTAILSHFYLLAGCAAPLWLEGEILSYFGIMSLGIGDALASIVGRRIGRVRWASTSGKTVEGSIAFFLSVVLASAVMWGLGVVDDFNPIGYGITTLLSTLLEAFSAQNDNLILPMYGWALGTLLNV